MIYLIEVERVFRATNVFEVEAGDRVAADALALQAAKEHDSDAWFGDEQFRIMDGETEDEHERKTLSGGV